MPAKPFTTSESPRVELSAATRQDLVAAIREYAYPYLDDATVASEWFQNLAVAEGYQRQEIALRHLVPWIARTMVLSAASVLEIGCGTGSVTAALAPAARHVYAYDVYPAPIATTRRRMAIMGYENFDAEHFAEATFLDSIMARHAEGVDIVLLNAVLEHMPILARVAYLQGLWTLLKPGGVMVVGDTPNRLIYADAHTSDLPFFDQLPDDLAVRYAARSPRKDFRDRITSALAISEDEARRQLTSAGRGASFHEFELALGALTPLVVADGYDPEILGCAQPSDDEEGLKAFCQRRQLDVPAAFTRNDLYLILQKDGPLSPVTRIPQPLQVRDSRQAVLKPGNHWLLPSDGARITFDLPETHRQLVVGTIHHGWSGRMILTTDGDRVVADERLWSPVTDVRYREVVVPAEARRLTVRAVALPESLGNEVWLTYLAVR